MKLLVYGAGSNCRFVLERIDAEDTVLCIADADSKKHGTEINGAQVVAPEKIAEQEYDKILVSINNRDAEIKESLVALGVREEDIVFWRDYVKLSPHNTGTVRVDWDKGITAIGLYEEMCSHAAELSEMERFYLTGEHNRSFKWLHYFEIYNRHFAKYIGKDITIMEIGVNKGGSLQIWKKIFGPGTKIIGVDINPECKQMEDDQISIYIGNQADREFWQKVKQEIPKLDILIDDGGHYMEQQIVTFEEMFSHVKEDGVYLCEDTGTSYYPEKYNSGCKKPGTFIEYSKNFIDYIHAWYSQEECLQVNECTRTMNSLHYYYGVLAIEKRVMYPPFDMEVCTRKDEKYARPHFHGTL